MADRGSDHHYLVVARVGDRSLHREWIRPGEYRNFDLCLSYYGDQPGRYAGDCQIYKEAKGPKWPPLYDLIKEQGDRIFAYDAIWFPDDDILTDSGNISRMFELFSEHRLMLAQPALTANSYFQVTAQHIDYKLRYTSFVEIMVPIFSQEALRLCWSTFNKSVTGWGMEHVWALLLGYPDKGMAILDETPVKHTRPPGQGELYENIKRMNIDVLDPRFQKVWNEYGITAPAPSEITYYSGIKAWDPYAELDAAPNEAVRQNQPVSKVKKTVKKWRNRQTKGRGKRKGAASPKQRAGKLQGRRHAAAGGLKKFTPKRIAPPPLRPARRLAAVRPRLGRTSIR